MKLKTAIYIIDTSYGLFIISGLLGIVLCIATLREGALLIGILAVVVLFIVAFLVKRCFINLYLKNCKYPFEFLSVLEQLGLTKDLQVNWSEDFINGPDKRLLNTQEFLRDNQLTTDYQRKRRNIAFSDDQGGQAEMLSFHESGLLFENTSYEWSKIKCWGYIDSDTHAGKMEITYENNASQKRFLLNFGHFNINPIDLMLLLSHFKAKYGS